VTFKVPITNKERSGGALRRPFSRPFNPGHLRAPDPPHLTIGTVRVAAGSARIGISGPAMMTSGSALTNSRLGGL
jgi:hypothetical protein